MDTNEKQEFVVVENGQRVSKLMTEQQAKLEATKRRPTNESTGQEAPKVEVKQNLCG